MEKEATWVEAVQFFWQHNFKELDEMYKDPEWRYKKHYYKYKYNIDEPNR